MPEPRVHPSGTEPAGRASGLTEASARKSPSGNRPRHGERVVVVGAGAIGLSCAYFLQRAGFEVTIVDEGTVGSGASWGNAGWVSPSLLAPIPGPAALRTALTSIGRPDSPLWVQPQMDPGFLIWGMGFLRHCTRLSNDHGLAVTARLAGEAFRYFDEMILDGLKLDLHRRGLLFISRSRSAIEGELAELSRIADHAMSTELTILSGDECRARETIIGPEVTAGIYVATDGHMDPRQFTAGLASLITSRGGTIHTGQRVRGFVVRRHRVAAVQARDEIAASHVVIAAGAKSTLLAKKLGVRLTMTAGKGYSFSVDCPQVPSTPMYLLETRAGATPLGDRLRVAGTIEFSGLNLRRDPRRLRALQNAAGRYFRGLDWSTVAEEWTGMRPLCPDGLPVLDRIPGTENAYLATGHSTLGITLASVTGAHIATFVRDGVAPDVLRPFRLRPYLRGREQ